MNKTILDTDTYSEVTKGKNQSVTTKATAYLSEFDQFTLSALTVFEILWSLHKNRMDERFQSLLQEIQNIEVLAFDTSIAELAGRIYGDLERIGQPIGLPDVLIAATAIRHNLILTTGNTKHHLRIVNLGYALQLDNWKTI